MKRRQVKPENVETYKKEFEKLLVDLVKDSEKLQISTKRKIEVLDITKMVEEKIKNKACNACLVFSKHTTGIVIINESEPNLLSDFERLYRNLAKDTWSHDLLDGNAVSHLIAGMVPSALMIPVNEGRLSLGQYQSVLFIELDGPRTREIEIKML